MNRIALAAALLWGCAARAPVAPPPQVVIVPAPAGPTDPVAGMLAAAGVVVGMPRERQIEEVDRWNASLERTDQPSDRLRMALLLTLGDPDLHDPERVRTLLADRTWGSEDAGYETLARLLLELVETRSDGARERLELALALEQQRERTQQLETQLEAMKAIEADIDARETPEDATSMHPGG